MLRPVRTVARKAPIGPRPAWQGLFLEPAHQLDDVDYPEDEEATVDGVLPEDAIITG